MATDTQVDDPSESSPLELVADAAGELFARFGLRAVLGRIWAVLFLAPEPLDAESLRSTLGISSGSLSMGLNELIDLGLVYRSTPSGERRFYYRAEAELWSVITRIFKERERVRIAGWLDRIKEAEAQLGEAEAAGQLDDETRHRLDRVRHLVRVGTFVIDLFDAFVERTRVEIKAAQKWLSVSGKLGGEPLSRLRRRINAARGR
jgi:DNA-binding transcriptional regulator GbsR (MarR family)